MKWTRHEDYLTTIEEGIRIDWTPDAGPRFSMEVDGLGPLAFAAKLTAAQSALERATDSAELAWARLPLP